MDEAKKTVLPPSPSLSRHRFPASFSFFSSLSSSIPLLFPSSRHPGHCDNGSLPLIKHLIIDSFHDADDEIHDQCSQQKAKREPCEIDQREADDDLVSFIVLFSWPCSFQAESLTMLFDLQTSITGDGVPLLFSPSRALVKEGWAMRHKHRFFGKEKKRVKIKVLHYPLERKKKNQERRRRRRRGKKEHSLMMFLSSLQFDEEDFAHFWLFLPLRLLFLQVLFLFNDMLLWCDEDLNYKLSVKLSDAQVTALPANEGHEQMPVCAERCEEYHQLVIERSSERPAQMQELTPPDTFCRGMIWIRRCGGKMHFVSFFSVPFFFLPFVLPHSLPYSHSLSFSLSSVFLAGSRHDVPRSREGADCVCLADTRFVWRLFMFLLSAPR